MNYFAASPWEKPFASPMGLAFCIFLDVKPRFFSRSMHKYTFCNNHNFYARLHTVTTHFAVLQVMVAVPFATAVTLPAASTLALLDAQDFA